MKGHKRLPKPRNALSQKVKSIWKWAVVYQRGYGRGALTVQCGHPNILDGRRGQGSSPPAQILKQVDPEG